MRIARIVVLVVIGAGATTCGNDKPPSSPTPFLQSIALIGETTIAPGATVQFRLEAVYSNGAREDVTAAAQWNSFNQTLFASLGGGRFEARSEGTSGINTRYNNRSLQREVIIVPAGTFRITGRVVENGNSNIGVPGAHIQARNGGVAGPSTDSDSTGFYQLHGVVPNADLIVTRTGYTD